MDLMTSTRVRVLLALLLAGSGALAVAASAQRWWSACGLTGFDTAACLREQDHAQDLAVRGDVSLLLLAAAVALLPLLGARRAAGVWAAAAVPAASLALLTVPGLPSAVSVTAVAVWMLGWPVPVAFALLGVRRGWLLVALLVATTPLAQLLLVPLVTGYASYDTAPWSEAVLGLTTLAAAMSLVAVGGPQQHEAPRDPLRHDRVRRPRAAAHG
jgi:hypothetical protein